MNISPLHPLASPASDPVVTGAASLPEAPASSQGSTAQPMAKDELSREAPHTPTGLYRIKKAEGGSDKIIFDPPQETAGGKEARNAAASPSDSGGGPRAAEKAEEEEVKETRCTVDTGKVDREIKHLKEKKKSLEKQVAQAGGDPARQEKLSRQLEQIERELLQKDTDAYRRQHAAYR